MTDSTEKLDLLKKHIKKRYEDLETRLDLNEKIYVRFPGKDGENLLGEGKAKEKWNDLDSILEDEVTDYIQKLTNKLKSKYKERVEFGIVGKKKRFSTWFK